MRTKKEAAIVIPIYKTVLNDREKISLLQALKVLGRYDIIIVAPEKLKIENANKYCRIERFPTKYFQSVDAYNNLMLSVFFYERFAEYEYILIYQLDAFVFSNKLSFFCEKGYDYIGAPWLYGIFHYIDESHCIWRVGNGGLSLRKVSSFIRILEEKKPFQNNSVQNEDLFFSSISDVHFTIAPIEVALQFSFERQVEKCFELNHHNLPFGCHAWEKYDFKFWKPYIEQGGYTLEKCDGIGKEDILLHKQYKWLEYFSCLWEQEVVKQTVRETLIKNMDVLQAEYILFGVGYFGQGLGKWFVHNHIPFKGYCDNNIKLHNEWIDGYQIMSPNKLLQCKGTVKIMLSLLNHVEEVERQLQHMGFERYIDYILFEDIISVIEKGESI